MTTAHLGDRPIRFAAVGLDHAHAFGQIEGLLGQGCELVGFSSDDKAAAVARTPAARGGPTWTWRDDPEALLSDPSIDLIVTAAVPDRRAAIALTALRNGKDVVADKPGCITLDELADLEKAVAESGQILVGHLLRTVRGALRGQGRRARPRRPDRPGRADPRTRAAPRGRPRPPRRRRGTTRLVLRPGPNRRHHHRHRQPPDRPVPLLHRFRDRRGRLQHGRQLHPPRLPAHAGLRRDDSAVGDRPRIRPGRLVHPAGPADLGRRPAGDLGHRGLHRAAQVRRHRRSARQRPPLRGRRRRHRVRRLLRRVSCPTTPPSCTTWSTAPRPRARSATPSRSCGSRSPPSRAR